MNPTSTSPLQPSEIRAETTPAPDHGMTPAVPAADAAALSLVALLTFCVVCFAWGAAILGRREKDVLQAASEGQPPPDAEAPTPMPDPGKKQAPWEREADWWKK